jgi:hypothetical protein
MTGKRVLPKELERCAATGKRVLRGLMVTSSLSGARLLEELAIRSATGEFCAPTEARTCVWSARRSHPADLRTCALTGLVVHFEFATTDVTPSLRPLVEILDGVAHTTDALRIWDTAARRIATVLKSGRCHVVSAVLSPTKQHLAVCAEVRTLLGMRVRHVGAVYHVVESTVVGRLAEGKRSAAGWTAVAL